MTDCTSTESRAPPVPGGDHRRHHKRTNLLVSLEGIEGSGKTSVASFLLKTLSEHGITVSVAPEFVALPMRAPIDEALARSGFISESFADGPRVAVPYMLLHEVMKAEGAEKGCDVTILDRSYDSVAVYQGIFLPVAQPNGVLRLHAALEHLIGATGLSMPRRTYLLDTPVEVAAARYQAREGVAPSPSVEARLDQIRELFLQIAARNNRFMRVDASENVSRVAHTIAGDIRALIGGHG